MSQTVSLRFCLGSTLYGTLNLCVLNIKKIQLICFTLRKKTLNEKEVKQRHRYAITKKIKLSWPLPKRTKREPNNFSTGFIIWLYDTNQNKALLRVNPSKWPQICINFDPPQQKIEWVASRKRIYYPDKACYWRKKNPLPKVGYIRIQNPGGQFFHDLCFYHKPNSDVTRRCVFPKHPSHRRRCPRSRLNQRATWRHHPLLTMVIVSAARIGLWDPFHLWPFYGL